MSPLTRQGAVDGQFLAQLNGALQAAGIITPGNIWWVRPRTGNDSNDGTTPATAFQTLARAQVAAVANQNDVVLMCAEGNTASQTTDYQTALLTWGKDLVHLIGINSGSMFSQRSRVAFNAAYAAATDLFLLSANGCVISNIEFFMGVASVLPTGCMTVTGERNRFFRCHIAGFGGAAGANDIAGAYDLQLKGASENLFEDCVIGIDTITRAAQINANIYTAANAGVVCTRNTFRNCEIRMSAGHATNPQFLRAPTGTIDRSLEFDDCLFFNAIGSGATSLTECMTVVLQGGLVIMRGARCGFVGAGKWNATASVLYMVNGTIAATTSGYGGNVT